MNNYDPSKVSADLVASLKARFESDKRAADYATDPRLWARDKLGVHLWSKQVEITESVRDHKRTVVASCHGSGKALTLDTPLRTPTGYTTMGDVQVGDWLLDENYRPTRVVATTPIHEKATARMELHRATGPTATTPMHDTYGYQRQVITSSFEHEWMVLSPTQMAHINVITSRHGIKQAPDFSYWMHRAEKKTTLDLYSAVPRANKEVWSYLRASVIPAAREINTAFQLNLDLATYGDAHFAQEAQHRGTVDPEGRLSFVYEVAQHPTIKHMDPPADLQAMREFAETKLDIRTLLVKKRKGHSATYWLVFRCEPMELLRNYVFANDMRYGVDALCAGDIQAIALQKYDEEQYKAGEALPWRGHWSIVKYDTAGKQLVKCVEVDSEEHLYLAGKCDVPTHNSMIASVIAAWWIDVHPPGSAIVVSTAPTYAQVHAILWEEIRKHHATAKDKGLPLPGSITMADNWNLDNGQLVGFGRKPKDGDRHAFQGIHRRFVLAILDEACGVPEELWTGAEAITTNEGCRILAIGNPDDRDTEFGKNYCDPATAQDWNRISIPAFSTPNLTGEPVPPLLNEVLVARNWVEERKRGWGEDDPRYISKVLAEFPEQNQASLFSPVVIATAFEDAGRKLIERPVTLYFGLDVARYGGDLSVLSVFDGVRAKILDSWSGMDTVSTATRALTRIGEEVKDRKARYADIRVDAVGLGAGVVDTMAARRWELAQELAPYGKEPWFNVREMHGSAAAPKNVGGSVQGYGNARAWWFDQLKHLMRSGALEIEQHAKLQSELGGIRYDYRNGKLYIESKEEMRKDGRKSPDYADSLVYACAPVHEGLETGDTVSEDAYSLAQAEALNDAMMTHEMSISPF